MSRILVSGAGGFIGGRVASVVTQAGHEVLRVDRSAAADDVNVLDLADWDRTRSYVEESRPDVFLHVAGVSSGRLAARDPLSVVRDTVVATANVLEAARLASVRRVVVTSSMFVYAATTESPASERSSFDPRGGGHVHTTGFITKELLASDYARQFGLDVVVLRLAPVYGTGMWAGGVAVGEFVRAALAGRPLQIHGSGDDVRPFVHVDDVARAFLDACDSTPGLHVHNVFGPQFVTILELAEMVLDEVGSGRFEYVPMNERRGELDCGARIIETLRAPNWTWTARVPLRAGIRELIEASCATAKFDS